MVGISALSLCYPRNPTDIFKKYHDRAVDALAAEAAIESDADPDIKDNSAKKTEFATVSTKKRKRDSSAPDPYPTEVIES